MAASKERQRFDYREAYARGQAILIAINWEAVGAGLLRLPSVAMGSKARVAIEASAGGDHDSVKRLIDDVQLAARIDHFIAIGGDQAKTFFLAQSCEISREKIAKLSRRMPQFIRIKLTQLYAGSTNVDSNPTAAFDTDGWQELSKRLARFAATAECCATAILAQSGRIDEPGRKRIIDLATSLRGECAILVKLLERIGSIPGLRDAVNPTSCNLLDVAAVPTKLAQVIGVVRKCRRDLASDHWDKSARPTPEEWDRVCRCVSTIRRGAATIIEAPNVR